MKALLLFGALIALPSTSHAHDSWINWGGYKGIDGTHCCGENDCEEVPSEAVHVTPGGYALSYRSRFTDLGKPLDIAETVPFAQTQASEDGKYWRCRRYDNTRRCFFAGQPGS